MKGTDAGHVNTHIDNTITGLLMFGILIVSYGVLGLSKRKGSCLPPSVRCFLFKPWRSPNHLQSWLAMLLPLESSGRAESMIKEAK